MILSDLAIELAVSCGDITIAPFKHAQLNPASYNLTLGPDVLVLDHHGVHDIKDPPPMLRRTIDPIFGIVIRPGIGYLMHTVERVATNKYVPVIDGRSSVGRLFVGVHVTAGFGDPGYDGQWTLEVTTLCPIRLYAGLQIAQMRFHTIAGEVRQLYEGSYRHSEGPVASRAWKQFRDV